MDTKNILIIILVIVFMIMTVIVTAAVVTNMNNSQTYERVNLSSTCSLELPKIHFEESTNGGSSSYAGVTVNMQSKVLTSSDLAISYLKTTDNTGISMDGLATGNSQFNVGHQDWYSRDISNSATGETLLIMGKDKKQVDHIADSVKFTGGNNNTNNNTNIIYINASDNSKNTSVVNPGSSVDVEPASYPSYEPIPSPEPTPTPTPTPEGGGSESYSFNAICKIY